MKRLDIARDVIYGSWGSGDKRVAALKKAGYNPEVVQGDVNTLLCCRENIIGNIKATARRIADNNNWWYVYWTEQYGHECAICHPHGGENHGWQCIGYAMACWHHSGLPIPCNCGVIANEEWEDILNAKTDAEALKIARRLLKINDIQVIRNANGISKSKAQAGDMGALFVNGREYQHTFIIMSGSKIADSTNGGSRADDIRADRDFSGGYVSKLKVIIRYTGKGLCPAPKRTVDQLAHEVLEGLWGSGDSRVTALTQAGHDYNAVQKRVNEILDPTDKKGYGGKFPEFRIVKSNAQVIADTIEWAKWIAADNRFHYGYGDHAHHNGCYFCGTQGAKKGHGIVDPDFTYCCNPFVHAAWAHGGCIPTAHNMCMKGRSWDFNKGSGYDACSLFTKLGKPAQSKLKAGDVLCNGGHVALYIGDGKIAEASGGDNNVRNSKGWNNSIHITSLYYGNFDRVYRFNSSVDATYAIMHGEVSYRVKDLQRFLNWYGNYALAVDGEFGDKTLKALLDFQKKEKLTADGICGPATIAKMKTVRR